MLIYRALNGSIAAWLTAEDAGAPHTAQALARINNRESSSLDTQSQHLECLFALIMLSLSLSFELISYSNPTV